MGLQVRTATSVLKSHSPGISAQLDCQPDIWKEGNLNLQGIPVLLIDRGGPSLPGW